MSGPGSLESAFVSVTPSTTTPPPPPPAPCPTCGRCPTCGHSPRPCPPNWWWQPSTLPWGGNGYYEHTLGTVIS